MKRKHHSDNGGIRNSMSFTTMHKQAAVSILLLDLGGSEILNPSTVINRLQLFVLISYGQGDQKF